MDRRSWSAPHPEARGLFKSGYTDDVLARRGSWEDPELLIQKPFRINELLTRVRHSLDSPSVSA